MRGVWGRQDGRKRLVHKSDGIRSPVTVCMSKVHATSIVRWQVCRAAAKKSKRHEFGKVPGQVQVPSSIIGEGRGVQREFRQHNPRFLLSSLLTLHSVAHDQDIIHIYIYTRRSAFAWAGTRNREAGKWLLLVAIRKAGENDEDYESGGVAGTAGDG